VAQYADESNIIAASAHVPRKLEVLAEHCERLGRDRSEITVSLQRSAVIAPTMEEAQRDLADGLARRGIDLASLSDDRRAALDAQYVLGDPDTVAERLAADLALGIDGFTINLPLNGHVPGRVALLGETVSKLLA